MLLKNPNRVRPEQVRRGRLRRVKNPNRVRPERVQSEEKVKKIENGLDVGVSHLMKEGISEKKVEQDANEMKAFNFGLLDVTLNFGKSTSQSRIPLNFIFKCKLCFAIFNKKENSNRC